MDNLNEVIGGNIQRFRVAMDISQNELGKLIENSSGAISRWEKGRNAPSAYYLIKLADVFGCSVDALLKGSPKS